MSNKKHPLSTPAKRLSAHLLEKHGFTLGHNQAMDALAVAHGARSRQAYVAEADAASAEADAASADAIRAAVEAAVRGAMGALRRKATAYANAGRDFPTFGVDSLLDAIDEAEQAALAPPKPKASSTKPGPIRGTATRCELRQNGDRAAFNLPSGAGFQIVRTDQGVSIDGLDSEGEVEMEETVWFDDVGSDIYDDEWVDIVGLAQTKHRGNDTITLAPDKDGEAVVEIGGLIRVRLTTITNMDDVAVAATLRVFGIGTDGIDSEEYTSMTIGDAV